MDVVKNLIEIFQKIEKKYEEVSSLKYGDIVWCKISESKKYKFEGRHRLRPFTVLYVDEEYIYCLTHTHSKNIGKQGYYLGSRLSGSLITDEIIKAKYKDFKNKFKGEYTKGELNRLSRYLYNIYKENTELTNIIEQHISFLSGDLVLLDNEKYLVRKEVDENKVSLIKLTSKNNGEVSFLFDNEQYFSLKDAIVCDKKNLSLIDIKGSKIIEAFESAKKLKDIKNKTKQKKKEYTIGNIILVNDVENVIIDMDDNYLILVDKDRNCSCIYKNNKYEIVGKIQEKEINAYKRMIDYDLTKKSNILLNKR